MVDTIDTIDTVDAHSADNVESVDSIDSIDGVKIAAKDEPADQEVAPAESDPAAFLAFQTHEDATRALSEVGYTNPHDAPAFSSAGLTQSVNELVKSEEILLMDMTDTLPVTPQAAFQALTVAAFNAAAAARRHEKAAFLIMRTQSNTPSFLFGHHWNLVQSLGKETAFQHVRNQPTPAAFVIFRGRELVIPSSICHVDETLAARLLAAEITGNPKHFCCELCGEGLASHDDAGNITKIEEVGVTPDKRLFKRACAEAHNAKAMELIAGGVMSLDVGS